MRFLRLSGTIAALAFLGAAFTPLHSEQLEKRIALVIGESAYTSGALTTGANDAGLVSETLQAAGFDVTGARDLDTQQLRDALHEFVDKARASGPDTVAMVYFAGYGLQSESENYLAGVDARIDTSADVAMNAIRASDFVKPLAALPLKARIVVLDAAHKTPFVKAGRSLAGGLALTEPDDESLIAFNAAPGTIGPDERGPYGAYAKALVEMIKAGGAPVNQMFDRVRERVEEVTKGGEIPWEASRIATPIVFFAHTAEAPKEQTDHFSELSSKPIASFSAHDAYLAAVARDTIEGYEEFLAAFPNDPLAKRVRAIVAARRESVIWRETCVDGKPRAYWSYLKRYPRGPHVYEARQRLRHFAVEVEPPPTFEMLAYDVPPPSPDEITYVEEGPDLYLGDPDWGFEAPPPVPVVYLVAEPAYFVELPPPPPPIGAYVLPIPTYYPVAAWVAPPPFVAPAPVNVFAANIHNRVVVDQSDNNVKVTNAAGQNVPPLPANAPAPTTNVPNPGGGALHAGVAAAAATLPAVAATALRRNQHAAPNPAVRAPNGSSAHAPAESLFRAPKNAAPLPTPGAAANDKNRPLPNFAPHAASPKSAASSAAVPSATTRVNPHVSVAHKPPSFAAPHQAGPRLAAPRQAEHAFATPRHAGPHFAAPQAAPQRQFAPRRAPPQAPHFAAPHFAPRPPAPHFAAPAAPHAPAAPRFAAPRPAPAFQAQHFAPPRPAPMAAPHVAAPPRPAPGRGLHLPGH